MTAHEEGIVYRPPGESGSLILRVTLGCSHNSCSFCNMYRHVRFRVNSNINETISKAASEYPLTRRVFLADGNALVLNNERLLPILYLLRSSFPKLTRVTCYSGPLDILRKTPAELSELREAGLKMVYLGVESGDDSILALVNKGVTASEMIEAGKRVIESGIKLSVMVITGLGGKEKSYEHAINTAKAINSISPNFLSTLTLTLYEGTPLMESFLKGDFIPLSPLDSLHELRTMIQHLNMAKPCIFRSDHLSNLIPLAGTLNKDKASLLMQINEVLECFESKNYPNQ